MKKELSVLILFFLASFTLFSQTSEKIFIPEVVVTLSNDSIIQLSDFEIHSSHYQPDYYYNVEHKGKIDGVPLKTGNIWYMKSFKEIDKIIFKRKENQPNGFISAWLDSKIFLNSGDSLIGETPKTPRFMWVSGNVIKIYGEVEILGKVGNFDLPIEEIKEIKRKTNNANEFILSTIKNEKKVLINPYLAHYAFGRSYIFDNYSYSHKAIEFSTEGVIIKLYQAELDSLAFYDDKNVFVKIKDENEAIGKFKKSNLYIKGFTKDGTIWYQSIFGNDWYINEDGHKRSKTIANIKSIKF